MSLKPNTACFDFWCEKLLPSRAHNDHKSCKAQNKASYRKTLSNSSTSCSPQIFKTKLQGSCKTRAAIEPQVPVLMDQCIERHAIPPACCEVVDIDIGIPAEQTQGECNQY